MPELEFRDGRRTVPDHVRAMMSGLETHKFTFAEAKALAEKKLLRDHLNQAQDNVIQRHLKDLR